MITLREKKTKRTTKKHPPLPCLPVPLRLRAGQSPEHSRPLPQGLAFSAHGWPWPAEAPWPWGSLLGKSWRAKTCEEPPWGLPPLTQKTHFSSGPHPLPLGSQPRALLALTRWLGFLAWPRTCPMAGAGVMVTGPSAVPVLVLAPHCSSCWVAVGMRWACALSGAGTDVVASLPPSAPAPDCPAAGPARPSLGLPMEGGTTLVCFPELIQCCKGQFYNLCASWKGQESIKDSTSQISFSLFLRYSKFFFPLHPVVEYIHLFLGKLKYLI